MSTDASDEGNPAAAAVGTVTSAFWVSFRYLDKEKSGGPDLSRRVRKHATTDTSMGLVVYCT